MRKTKLTLERKSSLDSSANLTKSYDLSGDVAVIRFPEHSKSESRKIAEAIMHRHKHVRTVLRQASPVSGDFRLRQLEWIAGENRTETTYKESGCVFKVDLARCYFSPRLSFERLRIARLVGLNEIVVNMFAGVGTFSIVMAKQGKEATIYSVDVNPAAVAFMRENIRLNRVQGHVVPVQGDAKEIIIRRLRGVADRVLMPLPEKAYEYLEYSIMALKPRGGWMHYYDFVHAKRDEDPVERVEKKVGDRLGQLGCDFVFSSSRVVRSTGPRWHQVVLDIHLGARKG